MHGKSTHLQAPFKLETWKKTDGWSAISVLLIAYSQLYASFSFKSTTFNTTHFCFLSWVPTELMNNVVLI